MREQEERFVLVALVDGSDRVGDFDADTAVSNLFEMEWPRGSGTLASFPEIDRAAWVALDDAEALLAKGQRPFVDRLRTLH